MKKIIIYVLIFFNSITFSVAQNFFMTEIGDDSTNITASNVIQNTNDEFILSGTKSYLENDSIVSCLIKLSNIGEVIQEQPSFLIDTNIYVFGIFPLENGNFLTCAKLFPKNTDWNNWLPT